MTDSRQSSIDAPSRLGDKRLLPVESPFIRAPEGANTVFMVTFVAACGPLLAGAALFGWRALAIPTIAIVSCVAIEWMYYRVTRAPALFGRTHAYLTGLLLALTLPANVAWYVPVVGAAFAIIVGKAAFGGVGHFLWQPALVGRLAVAVMFSTMLNSTHLPVLAQSRLFVGDVRLAKSVDTTHPWRIRRAPVGADAFLMLHPRSILRRLTRTGPPAQPPAYSALLYVPQPDQLPAAKPAALMEMPIINELLFGARPGGIGETCALIIIVSGLYLIYRNYVKWQLPLVMILSAWAVAAVAPVTFAGPGYAATTLWWPLLFEGLDVGFVYVNYQLLCGELMLAAFFLATEMTTRPVTTGGQVLFAIGCGGLGMLAQLYLETAVPFYMAILLMNTLTPAIDAMWRPRVFGTKRLAWLRRAK